MTPPHGPATDGGLDGPRRGPAAGGTATSLVILLHGVGADGADLISLADAWGPALPHTAFVSPNAPEPCDMAPFGYQWFSLMDRSPESLAAGVAAAAPKVDAFIDREMASLGLTSAQTALVGFSQGCMMALHVAPRRAEPLACVLGYSGALLGAEDLERDVRSRPPLFLVHGEVDEVVAVDATRWAAQGLSAAGFEVEARIERGLGHGIGPYGLRAGAGFLAKYLIPDDQPPVTVE
ncbi:MAG: dienelactone hydrolase family protein [Rhodospirillaceae bacterium]|nr:dienelactone hydrolase family protein [Rhodospirillaceae bacterium]